MGSISRPQPPLSPKLQACKLPESIVLVRLTYISSRSFTRKDLKLNGVYLRLASARSEPSAMMIAIGWTLRPRQSGADSSCRRVSVVFSKMEGVTQEVVSQGLGDGWLPTYVPVLSTHPMVEPGCSYI